MDPSDRRQDLRRCALALFAKQGYHATGVADIVKAAGVAQGTFYRYFPNKRALFDDLLDGLFTELRATVQHVQLGPGAPPPLDQLRANVSRVLAILLRESELTRVLLVHAVGLDPEADRKLEAFYGQLLELVERALGWGHRLGLARPGDPALQARMILGSIKELMYHQVVRGPARPVDALTDALLAFNTRGLLATP